MRTIFTVRSLVIPLLSPPLVPCVSADFVLISFFLFCLLTWFKVTAAAALQGRAELPLNSPRHLWHTHTHTHTCTLGSLGLVHWCLARISRISPLLFQHFPQSFSLLLSQCHLVLFLYPPCHPLVLPLASQRSGWNQFKLILDGFLTLFLTLAVDCVQIKNMCLILCFKSYHESFSLMWFYVYQ